MPCGADAVLAAAIALGVPVERLQGEAVAAIYAMPVLERPDAVALVEEGLAVSSWRELREAVVARDWSGEEADAAVGRARRKLARWGRRDGSVELTPRADLAMPPSDLAVRARALLGLVNGMRWVQRLPHASPEDVATAREVELVLTADLVRVDELLERAQGGPSR
jgi:hypothetical protein